jgi:Zn-finger nucleic acid-binding protein
MKSCPRCGTGLNDTHVGNIHVDGCIGCGGVWFDARELSGLAHGSSGNLRILEDRFWPGLTGLDKNDQAVCPNCSVALVQFEFPHSPGIPLDGCLQCKGIWVDDGELAAIQGRMAELSHQPRAETVAREDTRSRSRQALGFLAQVECASCQQPNPAASPVCWACGAKMPGERGIFCPRCDRPLQGMARLGSRIDACSHCGGVWLDGGELSVLLTQPRDELGKLDEDLKRMAAAPGAVESETLLCPICNVPMALKPFGAAEGVNLDTCDHCRGVWTDAGEFLPIAESARVG